jgi:transketolase
MNPLCRKIRSDILEISGRSGHGHVPTCFSVVECLTALYGTMRHDPANPESPDRDLFVLSKGHASLGHYCVLAAFGYFDVRAVDRFGAYGSDFGCHADRFKVPGVEVSTGSLGHGIGVAVGMALAQRILKSDRKVYTLIGDGEANEGSVWEAIMVANDRGLDNLTIIYDNNRSQGRCLQIPNPGERFAAFGSTVYEVDGHDLEAIEKALVAPTSSMKVIVANTVKGFGCSTLVDDVYAWHRRSPSKEELQQLMEELNAAAV